MQTNNSFIFSEKWNLRFMELAEFISTWSKDRSTKVGAVVVGPDKEIRSTGYNGFCRGIDDDREERHERPLKYSFFEHAERNSIYNASLYGASFRGCTMYVTMPPCCDCTRGIIQSGIKEVIFYTPPEDEKSNIQGWRQTVNVSLEMLTEAGVKWKSINRKLNPGQETSFQQVMNTIPWYSMYNLSENLIKVNGLNFQVSIAIEEISELVTEMVLNNSFDNLTDEIADLFITLQHIIVGYNISVPVISARMPKLLNSKFMMTDKEQMIAFLDLQKELSKNIIRGKNNLPQIIEKTANTDIALFNTVIQNNNLPEVKTSIDNKIERTIKREFIEKNRKFIR